MANMNLTKIHFAYLWRCLCKMEFRDELSLSDVCMVTPLPDRKHDPVEVGL